MSKELRRKREFQYLLILCAVLLAISFFLKDVFKTESASFELLNLCVAGLLIFCGVYVKGYEEALKDENKKTKN